MPKRIVQLCSGHPSNDARVAERTCKSLAQAGYDVHLIAADPASTPYERDGYTVHPVPKIESSLRRIRVRAERTNLAASLNPDLIQVHEPELLPGAIKSGKPVIYDVHELFVEVLRERPWIPAPLRKPASWVWERYEARLVRRCKGLIVVTPHVAEHYRNLPVDPVIVANFPDLSTHLSLPPQPRTGVDCIFSGTLSDNRGLFEMLQAFELLKRSGSPARLTIAGKGSEDLFARLRADIAARDLEDRVTLMGEYQWIEGLEMANRSSIGMVPHLNQGNNTVAWPVKMLDYMALGLPIVYSDLACHHDLLGGADVGEVCIPEQPETIAAAISRLIDNPDRLDQTGKTARKLVQEKLNWAIEREKLLRLVDNIIGPA